MTTLSLAPALEDAAVTLTVAGAPRAATNLVPNPSFETGSSVFWSNYGTGVVAAAASPTAKDGGWVGRVTLGTTAEAGAACIVPITAGTYYGLRASMRVLDAPGTYYARIQWLTSGGANVGSLASSPTVNLTVAGGWADVVVPATVAPATATQARLILVRQSTDATTGRRVEVDAITAHALEAGEVFTGGYFPTTRGAAVTITRTDANGTATVRLREGQEPIGGALIVTDYEAAMVGGITYTVVDSDGVGVTASTTLASPGAGPRLANIQLPAVNVSPQWLTGYEASASSATVVHWPVDRGDPVVMVRPARTREGTLTIRAASWEDAHGIVAVVAPGRLLQLRQADYAGMDMYFVAVDSEVRELELTAGGWSWAVVARYVEVKAPAVPLLGAAGWSFEDLTAAYPDFASVRAAFPDFAGVLVGP